MGVDAKWGRFPSCPVLSPFVPICPSWGGQTGTNRDKRGQNGTFRDKLVNAPISIYPHLALLNFWVPRTGVFGWGPKGFC